MKKEMSDEEWGEFLNAIPTGNVAPFGSEVEFLQREGVTAQDIKKWNANDSLDKQKIKEESEGSLLEIMAMLQTYENLLPDEAVKKVHQQTASFADYPYTEQIILQLEKLGFTNIDDYPLPWELKNRVDIYSDKIISDPELFKETQVIFSTSTSANAATRLLIQEGLI
jgi:hypothetical protein